VSIPLFKLLRPEVVKKIKKQKLEKTKTVTETVIKKLTFENLYQKPKTLTFHRNRKINEPKLKPKTKPIFPLVPTFT